MVTTYCVNIGEVMPSAAHDLIVKTDRITLDFITVCYWQFGAMGSKIDVGKS
jgi:hypothetical protein